MAKLKEITVRLQVFKNGVWTACEEFESLRSLKDKFNSAKNLSTGVQCMPGRFRFEVTLSEHYVWASEANALSIDLTFDGGNPINHYQLVILKSSGGSATKELGLNSMIETDAGLSYCIEEIAMPFDIDDANSPWFETSFEFERYARDPTKFRSNRTSSAYKGSLKMEIQPCVAKRNTRRNACITVNPKLEATWSDVPPAHEVTLKPTLKPDTTRECSSFRRYICPKVKATEPVSFMFHYREKGSYDKIHEEDVDIITNDRESVEKENRPSGSGPSNRLSPRQLSVIEKVSRRPPMAQIVNQVVPQVREEEHETHTEATLSSSVVVELPVEDMHDESMSVRNIDNIDVMASAAKITENHRFIEDWRRQRARAEQAFVRDRLEALGREIDETHQRLKMLHDEDSELQKKGEKLEQKLKGNTQQDSEDESENEERKRGALVKKAMLHLIDHQHKRLKRRRLSR